MKTMFTSAIVAAMMMTVAGTAYARDCTAEAQAAVDAATNPAGAALLGCGIGAGIGAIFSHGNGGAALGGCAVGGTGGVILSAAKQNRIREDAYNACVNGTAAPQTVAYSTSPAPSASAVVKSKDPNVTQVNVRLGPGTSYDVSEQIPVGTTVSASVCSNTGWCQIGGYNGPGWMAISLLHFN